MGTVGLLGAGVAPASANDWQHNPKSDYTYVPEGQEQSRVVGTPTLTPQQEADLAVKDAEAEELWQQMLELRAALESGAQFTASGQSVEELLASCPDGDCSFATAGVTQYAQERSYWCGPAMLKSLVRVRNVSISQSTAANRLGTTTAGTDWYDGNRYPVEYALDYYLGPYGANYVPVNLPGSPTSTQKSQFQSRLTANTNGNWGIAGDAWEVPGGPHLVGHPDWTIFHWFAIRGYLDWGARTNYADPASGAGSLSWGSQVPRYSNMNSNTVVTIMGGRGYIW